jgi:hypothetical protein
MSVKVKMNLNWSSNIQAGLQKGLLELTTDVERRAIILAPIDTGALRTSANITPVTDGYAIKFGSSRVPYARRQHFEHKTQSGYLAKAGENVARGNVSKYFKGKV